MGWTFPGGGGSFDPIWNVISTISNYNAKPFDCIAVTSGTPTITLPASPVAGDQVKVLAIGGGGPVIQPNTGQTLNGASTWLQLTYEEPGASVTLLAISSTAWWTVDCSGSDLASIGQLVGSNLNVVGQSILDQGYQNKAITSGAAPTQGFSSGVAAQVVNRDATLVVPATMTPTAGAAATVAIALSPDNVTYSTVGTETVPAGTALDSFVRLLTVHVPGNWYVRFTATNATLGTGTYY